MSVNRWTPSAVGGVMVETEDGNFVTQRDYEALEVEFRRVHSALVNARQIAVFWSEYAHEYYRKKWRLDDDLAIIDKDINRIVLGEGTVR